MEKITLKATSREITGKKVKNLRLQGLVPAVMYGKDKKGQSVQIDAKDFMKAYEKAGSSALIDLTVDDKNAGKVLIQDVQFDPVLDTPMHVDLYTIKMDEEITTQIPIKFVGESPAVEEQEGNFIANYDEVEVECLPGDLVSEIIVDISGLKTFDDNIKIADLNVPAGIKILDDAEQVVALVNPPRSEEELAEMEAEAAADAEKAGIEKMEADADAQKAEKEAEANAEENKETTNKPEEKKE